MNVTSETAIHAIQNSLKNRIRECARHTHRGADDFDVRINNNPAYVIGERWSGTFFIRKMRSGDIFERRFLEDVTRLKSFEPKLSKIFQKVLLSE